MLDDGDVVHSVLRQGPHGPYRSSFTLNTVKRYFADAHSLAHKVLLEQTQKQRVGLQSLNSVYEVGKHG